MTSDDGFPAPFRRFRAMMEPNAPMMRVTVDSDRAYALDTHHVMANGKRLSFPSVTVRRKDVSFHTDAGIRLPGSAW